MRSTREFLTCVAEVSTSTEPLPMHVLQDLDELLRTPNGARLDLMKMKSISNPCAQLLTWLFTVYDYQLQLHTLVSSSGPDAVPPNQPFDKDMKFTVDQMEALADFIKSNCRAGRHAIVVYVLIGTQICGDKDPSLMYNRIFAINQGIRSVLVCFAFNEMPECFVSFFFVLFLTEPWIEGSWKCVQN